MSFIFRTAEIRDANSIAGLTRQLGYNANSETIKIRLEELLEKRDNCVFVALANDEVVGWIHGFHTFRIETNSFVEICGLVVSKYFRKQGLVKILIEKVSKWGENRDCYKLRVRCNVVRKETHVFYEVLGFKMIKEQKVFERLLLV